MKNRTAIALALAFSVFYAEAAYAAVSVRVPVLCEADRADDVYITKMEALDDTLLETIREGLLYLKDTESGDFVMEFTEPGNYHYRVLQDEDASGNENFDSTEFAVDVYVSRNDDGTLTAEPVIYEMNGNKKKTAIRFLNMPRGYYEETETKTWETEEAETAEIETADMETEMSGTEKESGGEPDPGTGSGGEADSVKTMDDTPVMLFAALLLLSGAAAAAASCSLAKHQGKGAHRK